MHLLKKDEERGNYELEHLTTKKVNIKFTELAKNIIQRSDKC